MVTDLTCCYAIFSLFLNDCVWLKYNRTSMFCTINLLIHYTETTLLLQLFFSSLKFVSFFLFIYPHLHSSIFFKKLFERCKIKRKMGWVKRESVSCHTIGSYIVALQHYLEFTCTLACIFTHIHVMIIFSNFNFIPKLEYIT